MSQPIDIYQFKKDNQFYGKIDLLLTIKSFELGKIRQRYIESRKKSNSGRSGSVKRREIAMGGIAKVSVESGELSNVKVLSKLKEPRGLASKMNKFAISSENRVYILDKNGKSDQISNPWFSYIHTVDFSPAGERLLISSSGFDVLMEYELGVNKKCWEWFAWENGFNKGMDPEDGKEFILSRKPIQDQGIPLKVIADPENQSLPTAMRAAFINSALYDERDESQIIATFFHEGAVFGIHKKNGKATRLLENLKNPHGGRRTKEFLMATSTAGGEVVLRKEGIDYRYDFSSIPGKEKGMEGLEWLQNSIYHKGNIITIDSNRTSFVIFNPELKKYDVIPYNNDWAVQDIIEGELTSGQEEGLEHISQSSI